MSYSALVVVEEEKEFWYRFNTEYWKLQWEFMIPTITEMLMRRVFLQRPHTDDMTQMCQDLGVDTPEFQHISYDGLTFRWR